jgi:hypothetical protein
MARACADLQSQGPLNFTWPRSGETKEVKPDSTMETSAFMLQYLHPRIIKKSHIDRIDEHSVLLAPISTTDGWQLKGKDLRFETSISARIYKDVLE